MNSKGKGYEVLHDYLFTKSFITKNLNKGVCEYE